VWHQNIETEIREGLSRLYDGYITAEQLEEQTEK